MKLSRHLVSLVSMTSLATLVESAGCASAGESTAEEVVGDVAEELRQASAVSAAATSTGSTKPMLPPSFKFTMIEGKIERLTVGQHMSGGPVGDRYFIAAPGGKLHELASATGAQAVALASNVGKKVKIVGKPTISGAVEVGTVSVVSGSMNPDPPRVGSVKWLTIPCLFEDIPNPTPYGSAHIRALMRSNASYWSQASQGRLAIDAESVLDWQPMGYGNDQFYKVGTDGEQLNAIVTQCIARGAMAVDLDGYSGILLAFSHNLSHRITGGTLDLDNVGYPKKVSFAIASPLELANQAHLLRPMGLGLGLTQSGTAAVRFDSPWDVMSQGYGTKNGVSCNVLTPSFGCVGVLPAVDHTVQAGWRDVAQVRTLGQEEATTVPLGFANAPLAPGHAALIRVPVDEHRYVTIEARTNDGSIVSGGAAPYEAALPGTALVIHAMNTAPLEDPTEEQKRERTTRLRLLDARLDAAGTFTNNDLHVRVKYTRQSWGYVVEIHRGPRLRVIPAANGIVSGGGISCGTSKSGAPLTSCEVSAAAFDQEIFLNASKTKKSVLRRWHGCDSISGGSCRVVLSRSRTIKAEFQDLVECECFPDDSPQVCKEKKDACQ